MSNKVTVNIFGQEYTISGTESQERIVQVASWVDAKMKEIEEAVGKFLPTTSLAVLSSVNIANEMFQCKDELEARIKVAKQLEMDTQHYKQMWDEAKSNYLAIKDEAVRLQKEKEQLLIKLQAKEREIEKIIQGQGSIKEEIQKGTEAQIKATEAKYKDLENNFFDLQMENIRLKSENEKLRGTMK